MTEKEFQKTVLCSLQKLETNVSELKTDVSELKIDVSGLKTDTSSLKDRITTLEVFGENMWKEQSAFRKEQEQFNKKLFVFIENEIVDRLKWESDGLKGYADKKIRQHEMKFQHKAVA